MPETETKMNIMKEYHELYDEVGRDGLSHNQFCLKWANIMRNVLDCMASFVASYGDDEEAIREVRFLESCMLMSHGPSIYSDATDWKDTAVCLLDNGITYLDPVLTPVGFDTLTRDDVRWRRDASGLFLCPCFKKKHAWTPENCGNVRWAMIGRPVKGIKKPSAGQIQEMREAMQNPKWGAIRRWYEKQGHGFEPY